MLYPLKAHAHYFTVFTYLETWRGAKIGIFTHFTFTNLPRCKVWTHWYMYTLYRSPADDRRDHTSSYYRRSKNISVLPSDESSFLTLEFPPTRAGFPLQGGQGICYRIRKSQGNLIFFGKSQGKVREENLYPCKSF